MRRNRQQRPFLLLEVLIALFLVALCILPLLSPYVAIFRDQQAFKERVEVEHAMGLLYGEVVEELYKNGIPWSDIHGKKKFSVDASRLEELSSVSLAWEGHYWLEEELHKPTAEDLEGGGGTPGVKPLDIPVDLFTLYVVRLKMEFKSTENPKRTVSADHKLFIARQLAAAGS